LDRGCGSQPTFVRNEPGEEGQAVSELLPGEDFAVLEYAGGWAWGFCRADHVVGYVEAIALADPIRPTHIVCEPNAPVAPDDRIISPVIAHLPMGSLLHGKECGACLATEYGCVALSHLRAFTEPESDPVTAAERLKGAPWLDGGRSAAGMDAAGLIQLAFAVCGVQAPRLADQLAGFGAPATGGAERGDLVLFADGAGLMIDDLMMIHASRAAGKVVVEPLALHPGAMRRRPA
jgi:hypothetical protein